MASIDDEHAVIRRLHTFDLGAASKKHFLQLTFQPGQFVSTKIMKGLAQGHWVKTRIVEVHLRDGTLDLEVINNEKWNLRKLAIGVPFDHVDVDTSKALNDENNLLSLRVDHLLKQVMELRKSKLQTKKLAEELDLKLRERDYALGDVQKQLEEQMEKVSHLQKRIFNAAGEDSKEKDDNSDKANPGRTQSWAQGDLFPVEEGVPQVKPSKSLPMHKSANQSRRASIAGEETIEMLRLRKENEFLRTIAKNKPLDEIRSDNADLKVELSKSRNEIEGLIRSKNDLQIKLKVQDYETEGTKFLITKLQTELSEWKSGQRVAHRFTRERQKDITPSSNMSQVSVPNSIAYPPSQSRTTLRYAPSEASQSSLASEEMLSQYSRGGAVGRNSSIFTPPIHLNSRPIRGGGSRGSFRHRPNNGKPGTVFVSNPGFQKPLPGRSTTNSDWNGNFVRNRAGSRNESDAERSSIKSQDSYTYNKYFSGGSVKRKTSDVDVPRIHPLSPHQRSPLSVSSFRSGIDSQASASSLGSRVLRPSMREFFTAGNVSAVSSTTELADLQALPENTRVDGKSSFDRKDGGWISPKARSKMGWGSSRNLGLHRFSSHALKGNERNGENDNSKKSRTQKPLRRKKKHRVKPKDKHKPTQSTLMGLLTTSRNASSSSSVKKTSEAPEGGRHIVL